MCSQRVLPNNPRRGARTLHTYLTSLIVRLFNYDYNYKLVKHCQHNTSRRARRDYRKRNISSLAICTAHTNTQCAFKSNSAPKKIASFNDRCRNSNVENLRNPHDGNKRSLKCIYTIFNNQIRILPNSLSY